MGYPWPAVCWWFNYDPHQHGSVFVAGYFVRGVKGVFLRVRTGAPNMALPFSFPFKPPIRGQRKTHPNFMDGLGCNIESPLRPVGNKWRWVKTLYPW